MPEYDLAGQEWTIGTPDLIVRSPSMTLPATAPDYYGRIGPAPTGLTTDRYVKAVEFREVRHLEGEAERAKEGDLNYFVVHHAVTMATPGSLAEADARSRTDSAAEAAEGTASAEGPLPRAVQRGVGARVRTRPSIRTRWASSCRPDRA